MEEWKKRKKVMLSTKDLVFKKRPVKKLTERYVGPYEIEKIMSKNVVKLKLLALMRIYPVVNISKIMRYRELIKEQRVDVIVWLGMGLTLGLGLGTEIDNSQI